MRQKIAAKPTRVAIEELQLHDLKNMEAAVDVKQNASPARHDDAIPAMGPERKGIDMKAPMVDGDGCGQELRRSWECSNFDWYTS